MSKATLVVMAAGIGSRFGGGIKQLEPIGPNGEIIMDYSVYDAMEAGFDKVVFVIRKDLEKDFKEIIGNRMEEKIEVAYAFQEKEDIPEPYKTQYADRKKPWGTGQAILCCKDVVNEPFLVINADDYYGKEAYVEAYRYLTSEHATGERLAISMVGFQLGNTLSENGGVTRGICEVNENGMLTNIVETKNIIKTENGAGIQKGEEVVPVPLDTPVSMNMFSEYPYQIRKKLNGKILKESVNSDGYYQVNLNGHPYKKHRIIALQFISNPNNLPCVDHVNHIRTDNRIENLRWVSKSQNQRNQGSYNNVQINYIDYDNCPDDLMMVDKYNQHEFIDYYYSSENNRFYFDTGVNLRELHINFKNNGSAYVHALNTNGKKICIYYSVFKRMHDINF